MKSDIVDAISIQWKKGFLSGADGNFSFKDSEGRIWITPSGKRKHLVTADQFVLADQAGASSELAMHLAVYEKCSKASVVFHAHPPTAVAWSIAHPEASSLPGDVISELTLAAGVIPIVSYARPGTSDMGEQLKPYLPESRVLILQRHGALTWGESVEEALNGMERLEHSCEIFYKSQLMGQVSKMSEEESLWLVQKRESMGEKVL